MRDDADAVTLRLNELLAAAGLAAIPNEQGARFADYLSLLLRWNARINLTAIRDQEGILSRHFVESIVCARALPAGISTLLDFGSGAGFPGIPIAFCRPEIAITLAESQGKKAAFLREAVRVLEVPATVHSGRADSLAARFDCVAMRAVDRMPEAVQAARRLLNPSGWLALMTTQDEWGRLRAAMGDGLSWDQPRALPGSRERILVLAQHKVGSLF